MGIIELHWSSPPRAADVSQPICCINFMFSLCHKMYCFSISNNIMQSVHLINLGSNYNLLTVCLVTAYVVLYHFEILSPWLYFPCIQGLNQWGSWCGYLFKTHHTLAHAHVDKAQVCIISLINWFPLWEWESKHWVWRKESSFIFRSLLG